MRVRVTAKCIDPGPLETSYEAHCLSKVSICLKWAILHPTRPQLPQPLPLLPITSLHASTTHPRTDSNMVHITGKATSHTRRYRFVDSILTLSLSLILAMHERDP
jgi:hypothetical protein